MLSAPWRRQEESLEQRISHSELFPEPLAWVEPTAPSLQEDQSLQAALALATLGPLPDSLSPLEDFITNYPQSPWVPALRAGLARAYHETGRDTLALQHWQAAWNATSGFNGGSGKHVADYTLAHWTRLLASLGRIETLDAIMLETQGRVLDRGPLSQMWCRTRESWVDMHLRPGVSYKCGTLALHNVKRVAVEADEQTVIEAGSKLGVISAPAGKRN